MRTKEISLKRKYYNVLRDAVIAMFLVCCLVLHSQAKAWIDWLLTDVSNCPPACSLYVHTMMNARGKVNTKEIIAHS
jgi:hypothetical protein